MGDAFGPTDCPKRHTKSAFRVYDGEAMIVLPNKSEVKVLNDVGTRIWELIDGQTKLEDIIGKIVDEFEVEPERARVDALEFLNDLHEHGMVTN